MQTNRKYIEAGSTRFINFACLNHLPVLEPEWARDVVVDSFALAKDRLGFSLYAFAVMPDHVHLLMRPDDEIADVSKILAAIKTHSSKRILAELRSEKYPLAACQKLAVRESMVWQKGGGFDRIIFSAHEFLEKANYVEANPVKAGLSPTSESYVWCSAGSPVLTRDDWL